MNRKEELLEIIKNIDPDKLKIITPLIDKMVYLEERLNYLMTLPMIIVKDGDNTKQKVTPAYKQYKEFMQTYLNTIKIVFSTLGIIEADGDGSPLRKYIDKRLKAKTNDQ